MTAPRGTCRFCVCHEARRCDGGCRMVDPAETLCSRCADAEVLAKHLVKALQDQAPFASERLVLVTSSWSDLAHSAQQLLVQTVRAVIEDDSVRHRPPAADRDSLAALQLQEITEFIYEKRRMDIRVGETVSQLVCRLLEPVAVTR